MIRGEVIVFVTTAKGGRPRVSTVHLEPDTARVRAALLAVGIGESYGKEPADWPAKLRTQYVAELRARGLSVMVVDNRRKADSDGT